MVIPFFVSYGVCNSPGVLLGYMSTELRAFSAIPPSIFLNGFQKPAFSFIKKNAGPRPSNTPRVAMVL